MFFAPLKEKEEIYIYIPVLATLDKHSHTMKKRCLKIFPLIPQNQRENTNMEKP